jgi:hypothetical protein
MQRHVPRSCNETLCDPDYLRIAPSDIQTARIPAMKPCVTQMPIIGPRVKDGRYSLRRKTLQDNETQTSQNVISEIDVLLVRVDLGSRRHMIVRGGLRTSADRRVVLIRVHGSSVILQMVLTALPWLQDSHRKVYILGN